MVVFVALVLRVLVEVLLVVFGVVVSVVFIVLVGFVVFEVFSVVVVVLVVCLRSAEGEPAGYHRQEFIIRKTKRAKLEKFTRDNCLTISDF